jgi:hypothetical protein
MPVFPRQIEAAAKVLVALVDQAVKTDRPRLHLVDEIAEQHHETAVSRIYGLAPRDRDRRQLVAADTGDLAVAVHHTLELLLGTPLRALDGAPRLQ